jgi:hypothetical protein
MIPWPIFLYEIEVLTNMLDIENMDYQTAVDCAVYNNYIKQLLVRNGGRAHQPRPAKWKKSHVTKDHPSHRHYRRG